MRITPISRRMALAGAALLIGLTACGSPTESASTATVATAPTSVASPAVIRIAGAAGSGNVSAAADAMPTVGSKMMVPMDITYVFAGEAPDFSAPAGAWSFPSGVAATPEQVAAIAAALGVQGEVRPVAPELGGGFMVGPDDWSGPTLTVSADPTLGWWYNPGPSAVVSVPDCVIAVDPVSIDTVPADVPAATDATKVAPCPEPQPPANVPTAAAAEESARALFASLGIDLGRYELETYADEWGASVTAWLVLDGMRTPMATSIGFGAEGAVTWASGFLAAPQRGDDYPRITVDEAVARLNDQADQWMYPMATARGGVAMGAPIAVSAAAPMPPDTMPPDTMPAPEPVVVTFTAVKPSLEMIWSDDGNVWLLPGYAFTSSDGGTYSVIAVTDEYLEQVQPDSVPVDTLVTPVPGDTTVVEEPAPADPGAASMSLDEVAALVVGLSEADAVAAAQGAGITLRVARVDGVDQPMTMDYRLDRFNVVVEGGVVTAVLSNG